MPHTWLRTASQTMDAHTLHSVGAVQGLSHAKRALLAAVYTVTVACNGWVILALKPSTEQVLDDQCYGGHGDSKRPLWGRCDESSKQSE